MALLDMKEVTMYVKMNRSTEDRAAMKHLRSYWLSGRDDIYG
jgi:hypothetical protein